MQKINLSTCLVAVLCSLLLAGCDSTNAPAEKQDAAHSEQTPTAQNFKPSNGDARQVAEQFRQAPDSTPPHLGNNAPDLSTLKTAPNKQQ